MKKLYTLFTAAILFTAATTYGQNYVLFGNAQNGGSNGRGTLFQYNMKYGITSAPVNFSDSMGSYPNYGALTLDSATGLLFGTTYEGGRYSYGTIFSYGYCSGYQTMVNMQTNAPEGDYPEGNLSYDKTTGLFYGLTDEGGTYDAGTLFSFNPVNSKFAVLFNFSETVGAYPDGSLTWDPNTHLFYGLASEGGANGDGSIFSFDPGTGSVNVLHSFNYTDGRSEYNSLTYNPVNKLLYGTASQGGASGDGVLFSFDPSTNKDSTVINFSGLPNGSYPENNVLFNPLDSLLYGLTYNGGANGEGVIYSYNPKNGQDSIRVMLDGTKGSYSSGTFIYNPNDSLLYAMASQGGTYGQGTLFSFNPRTNFDSLLVNFGSPGASYPYGDLLLDTAKNLLYGLTEEGGTNGYGAAFVYNIKNATDSILVNFNDTNGAYPYASLTKLNGMLYATTEESMLLGSSNGPGLIFSYNPVTGQDSVMHRFMFTAKENYPENTHLTYNHANGMYYGVSSEGGIYNVGTLFSFNPVTLKDSVLFNFNDTIGEYPYGTLTYCPSNGLLYGTAEEGGSSGSGAIYNFNPVTGKVALVTNLTSPTGTYPIGGLTYCPSNGLLYGNTEEGGTSSYGVIFSLDPSTNTYTDIINFNGTDGRYPESSLTYNTGNGMFYGMTDQGGSNTEGNIFMFNPSTNKDSLLYSFDGTTGQSPASTVTMDPSDTIFYGVTENGGTNGVGVIFSYNINSGKDSTLFNFDNTNGSYPICDLVLINTKIAVTATKDTSVCKGSNITLTASAGPGSSYTWDNGSTTSSITVSPLADSNYSVLVCRGIYNKDTTIMVTVNPSPTVTVTGRDTIMIGDMDTLGASGAITYIWNPGGATTDSVKVSPATTTTYTVTGAAANGCTNTTTFTVVVNTITGIQNVSQGSTSVYPNPAKQTMYLTFSLKGSADATIQIMNAYGETVLSEHTTIVNGETMPFDISNLATGVYFAHIVANNQTQVVRFVKE